MYTLDELKKQNGEIIELCDVLCVLLKEPSLYNNTYAIELMNQFKEKVWMHLVFEDNTIYYELTKHPDDEVSRVVEEFHQSGREIKKQFSNFIRNWKKHVESGEEHESIHNECRDIFTLIRERVRYENENMFPLVKRLQAA